MISACMIVRDGAETLEKALKSLDGYVEEIVVGIDSRTVDNSEAIARQYNAKVFPFDWINDFSYARNLVASKADFDNILVIDADDELEPGKGKILHEALKAGTGARFNVQTSPTTKIRSIRLYNRKECRYVFRVHEYLTFTGTPTVVDVPITITHQRGSTVIEPGRNLKILEAALAEYPRYLFYHGRECLDCNRPSDALVSFGRYLPISTWPAEKCEAIMGIARAHVMLKELPLALARCFDVIEMDPNFMPAYNLLGQIYQVLGDYHSAVRHYEHAMRVRPTTYVFDDTEAIKFNCWGNLIVCYARTGDMKSARTATNNAQRIDKNSEWIKEQIKIAIPK